MEKQRMIEGFHFELGKVENKEVCQRMVNLLANVDSELAEKVTKGIGVQVQAQELVPMTGLVHANKLHVERSEALSLMNAGKDTIQGRRVAILAAEGVDTEKLIQVKEALMKTGAQAQVVSQFKGPLRAMKSGEVGADKNFVTTSSIMYDAIFIPGGMESIDTLKMQGEALLLINEAFKHCKPIAAYAEGVELLRQTQLFNIQLADQQQGLQVDQGVVTAQGTVDIQSFSQEFAQAIAHHRHREREGMKSRITGHHQESL